MELAAEVLAQMQSELRAKKGMFEGDLDRGRARNRPNRRTHERRIKPAADNVNEIVSEYNEVLAKLEGNIL